MSNIGMMEGAFFVGRKEVLDWVNNTLDLNLARIEDTANGAVACQILDIMYPGQVPMHKLNWAAKQDFEFVSNYKVLQTCFSKLNIEKHVDVDRLISGRYMDNLEFMQWFKKFYELNVAGKGDYDALAQRSKGKGGAAFNNGGKRSSIAASKPSAPKASVPKAAAAPTVKAVKADSKAVNNQENAAPNRNVSTPTMDKDKELASLRAALEESRKAYADLKVEMEGIDKEREFYFDKLRDIEVSLQDVEERGQGNELTAALFKILYATADGFEPIESDVVTAALNVPTNEMVGIASESEAVEETY